MRKPLFQLGQVVTTRTIADDLEREDIVSLIERHMTGDYGDLPQEDIKANEFALNNEERILSSYNLEQGKIYIITEWDRSVTTVMYANEY